MKAAGSQEEPKKWPRGTGNDLHDAARRGSGSETAAALSSGSFDVNYGDPEGWTPLMFAAFKGSSHVTKMLLDAGADVDIVGDHGTALHISLRRKHLAVTTRLVNAGADLEKFHPTIGLRPIHMAVDTRWPEATRVLLDAGADVDGRTNQGFTPLGIAATQGPLELVRILLDAKANPLLHPFQNEEGGGNLVFTLEDRLVRPRDQSGWQIPLDMAAHAGQTEVVRELIQRFGIEGCGGQTGGLNALGAAAMESHQDLIGIFAAAGVVDTGRVLAAAAGNAKEASVRSLLQEYGAGTAIEKAAYVSNTRDFLGRTPLATAVNGYGFYSSCRVVRMLLDHGAIVNAKEGAGGPIMWVEILRNTKEVQGGYATEEQMQRLEGIHRLLLQEDAARATSWLWPLKAALIARPGAGKTKKSATPLTTMLPILKRRAGSPRVLLTAFSRYYGKEDAPVTRDYSKDSDQLKTTGFPDLEEILETGFPDLEEILETVKEGLANANKSGT